MVELIEISLLPEEYRVSESPALKKNVILSTIGAVAIMVTALVFFIAVNAKLQSTINKLDKVNKEIAAKKPIQDRILELEKKQQQLTAKRDGLNTINVQRDKWVSIMEIYARNLPAGIWLSSITEAGSNISIKGSSYAFGEVGQLLARLESDTLISSVSLAKVSGSKAGGLVTFDITTTLPMLAVAAPPPAPKPAATKKKPRRKRRSGGH